MRESEERLSAFEHTLGRMRRGEQQERRPDNTTAIAPSALRWTVLGSKEKLSDLRGAVSDFGTRVHMIVWPNTKSPLLLGPAVRARRVPRPRLVQRAIATDRRT